MQAKALTKQSQAFKQSSKDLTSCMLPAPRQLGASDWQCQSIARYNALLTKIMSLYAPICETSRLLMVRKAHYKLLGEPFRHRQAC